MATDTLTQASLARTEDIPCYVGSDEAIIAKALSILDSRMRRGACMDSPKAVKNFLSLKLGSLEHEVFGVLFLNSQHWVIEWREMFAGTLAQTSVYPREVVKLALHLNAGAVVLCHNHPSGHAEPSRADEFLTQTLKTALALVDVRVIDHIVVAGSTTVSMAERGLI
jgi:DNA repair protein RadC